jgi:hypothetical protein
MFLNIASFNGIPKAGYRMICSARNVQPHPLSTVCYPNKLPKWIVYDGVIKTSGTFLRNITIIPDQYFELYFSKQTQEKASSVANEMSCIELQDVGPEVAFVLREHSGEYIKWLETKLKAHIEISKQGACIIVCCATEVIDVVKNDLQEEISTIKTECLKERQNFPTKAHGTTITMEPGGTVHSLLLADDYIKVSFQAIVDPNRFGIEYHHWETLLEGYSVENSIEDIQLEDEQISVRRVKVWGVVTFSSTHSARIFTSKIQRTNEKRYPYIDLFPCRKKSSNTVTSNDTVLNLTWHLGESTGSGFVYFADSNAATRALGAVLFIRGRAVKIDRNLTHNQYGIMVFNLEKHTDEEELKRAFHRYGCTLTRISRSRSDMIVTENMLRRLVAPFGEVEDIKIITSHRYSSRGFAKIHFTTVSSALLASERLHGEVDMLCKNSYIIAEHNRSYRLEVPDYVFGFFASELDALKKQADDEQYKFAIVKKGDKVTIVVEGTNSAAVTKARKKIDEMFKYETVFVNKRAHKHLEEQPNWLLDIEDDFRVRVHTQGLKQALVYGKTAMHRVAAVGDIMKELEPFTQVETWTYQLPKGTLKSFVKDVKRLKKQTKVDQLYYNMHKQLITAKGTPQAIEKLQQEVQQVIARIVIQEQQDVEECAICRCDIDTNSFQLGICGHRFCVACVKYQFTTAIANNNLPIGCVKCQTPFTVKDMIKLSDDNMESLCNTALRVVLTTRSSEFKPCPTPDCPQCYRVGERAFSCSNCLEIYCTKCNKSYHAGNCDDFDDSEMATFYRRYGVKPCPKCNAKIEKDGGCQHVTCGCGAHICWICMRVHETANLVYRCISAHSKNTAPPVQIPAFYQLLQAPQREMPVINVVNPPRYNAPIARAERAPEYTYNAPIARAVRAPESTAWCVIL